MIRRLICWLYGHNFQVSEELQHLKDAGIIAGEVEAQCLMCGKKGEMLC